MCKCASCGNKMMSCYIMIMASGNLGTCNCDSERFDEKILCCPSLPKPVRMINENFCAKCYKGGKDTVWVTIDEETVLLNPCYGLCSCNIERAFVNLIDNYLGIINNEE